MLFFYKKSIFCLFFLLLSSSLVGAETLLPDLRFGINGRTYPIGAQIVSQAGIGAPLWGDTGVWKYGYVRLGTNLATSAVVNRAGVEAQVFPISILGFSAGYDTGIRNFVPKFIRCESYQCNGRVDRKFLRGQMIAAAKGVIFSFQARFEELKAPNTTKPFFDEVTLLSGKNSGERMLTYNPALLYTLNDSYRVGFTSIYARAMDTGGYSHLYGPIVNWTDQKQWNGIVGIGLNSSALVQSGIAAFFSFQYTLAPSLSVADMSLRKQTYSSLF